MKSLSAADARAQFSDLLSQVAFGGERYVLTRNGKPIAAVIAYDAFEQLEAFEAMEDQIDIEESARVLAEIESKGTIPWETIQRELDAEEEPKIAIAL